MDRTVADIIQGARKICDGLALAGEADAARELHEVIEHPWTFGSEALVEIGLALEDVRSACAEKLLSRHVELLDTLIAEARKIFEGTQ